MEMMRFATNTVLFVKTMKTLVMAKKARNAAIEFGYHSFYLFYLPSGFKAKRLGEST